MIGFKAEYFFTLNSYTGHMLAYITFAKSSSNSIAVKKYCSLNPTNADDTHWWYHLPTATPTPYLLADPRMPIPNWC